MKCPVDDRELLLTHREGIELDYCPECRGIWLDRGELDKLIERSDLHAQVASRPRSHDHDDRSASSKKKPQKKMSSLLSDIFEFG